MHVRLNVPTVQDMSCHVCNGTACIRHMRRQHRLPSPRRSVLPAPPPDAGDANTHVGGSASYLHSPQRQGTLTSSGRTLQVFRACAARRARARVFTIGYDACLLSSNCPLEAACRSTCPCHLHKHEQWPTLSSHHPSLTHQAAGLHPQVLPNRSSTLWLCPSRTSAITTMQLRSA